MNDRRASIPVKEDDCFAIMPISDMAGYDPGHFARVYEHLIRPACEDIGLAVLRADEVRTTNYIALDIVNRVLSARIAVCDLSGRNPNVLYELGIRQAFDLPVVLIKDRRTERIFDIQGFRTVEYDESLRIDSVARDKKHLKDAIQATLKPGPSDINSLVALLGITKASPANSDQVSPDTALLLSAITGLAARLDRAEDRFGRSALRGAPRVATASATGRDQFRLPNGEPVEVGDVLYDGRPGLRRAELGTFAEANASGIVLRAPNGQTFIIPPDALEYTTLTKVPF